MYIVNYRSDVQAAIGSRKRTRMPPFETTPEDSVIALNDALPSVASDLGEDRAILLDSSMWTNKSDHLQTLNRVVDWLRFGPNGRFKKMLKYNSGDSPYAKSNMNASSLIDPTCERLGK